MGGAEPLQKEAGPVNQCRGSSVNRKKILPSLLKGEHGSLNVLHFVFKEFSVSRSFDSVLYFIALVFD